MGQESLGGRTMIRKIAIGFGAVMVIVGILGFVPGITDNGMLFGILRVNPAHNLIHLLSGIAGIAVGMATEQAARLFFQVFGVLYGLVAIAGLFTGEEPLFGIVALNHADHALHAVIAVFSLIVGFAFGNQRWRLPASGTQKPAGG